MDKTIKIFKSPDYNFIFNKTTGFFARWGKTKEEDPVMSEYGPEILDLEISTGKCSGNCSFCYKDNGTSKSHHMTLDEFKTVLSKMPETLTQIAFGITDVDANPDFFEMMSYARSQGVIPNYTCNGFRITDEIVKKTAELCGAVAVSVYDKDSSYNTIKKFTDAGMTQVNIHYMLSAQTYDGAFDIINDIKTDPRLKSLNAVVFLAYKHKNLKSTYSGLKNVEDYRKLINYCEKNEIGYGFDSCSAPIFFKVMEGTDKYKMATTLGEPCESSLFSSYINSFGDFYPCSFSEGFGKWDTGLSVLNCNTFLKDVWHNEKVIDFRNGLINSSNSCVSCISQKHCRSCPIYSISYCKE